MTFKPRGFLFIFVLNNNDFQINLLLLWIKYACIFMIAKEINIFVLYFHDQIFGYCTLFCVVMSCAARHNSTSFMLYLNLMSEAWQLLSYFIFPGPNLFPSQYDPPEHRVAVLWHKHFFYCLSTSSFLCPALIFSILSQVYCVAYVLMTTYIAVFLFLFPVFLSIDAL